MSAASIMLHVSPQDIRLLTDGWVCARRLVKLLEELPAEERPQALMFQLCAASGSLEQFLLAVATPRLIPALAGAPTLRQLRQITS